MSKVHCLREFVNKRLTAAAEEILGVFERTIVEYEEEIDRQRRLLNILPTIKSHRIELPQQHVCKEEEVLSEQQLCIQEKNYSVNQEDPEPPQIKEELCSSEEQLVLKQETDDFMLTPTYMESDHSEDQTLNLSISDTQSQGEENPLGQFPLQCYEASEEGIVYTNRDHQLLSHNSPLAESQDQKVSKHGDSGSTHAEPEVNQRDNIIQSPSYNVNSTTKSTFHKLKCEICDKGFKCKSKLQSHMRIHTGEKPYSCEICGKDFRRNGHLTLHLRVHSGEKPYSCKICGKDFIRQYNLTLHLRVHSGEKPYLCNTCGNRFSDSSTLKKHLRIHTDEKSCICTTCGSAFRHSSGLLRHNKKVHTLLTPEDQYTQEKPSS